LETQGRDHVRQLEAEFMRVRAELMQHVMDAEQTKVGA
jgi:hypothetical protein